jgi:hypothetical protein
VLAQARRVFAELPLLTRAGFGPAVLGPVVDVGHHRVSDALGMGHSVDESAGGPPPGSLSESRVKEQANR